MVRLVWDTGLGVLLSLSARLGRTTLASGMLTGSLLGWTVLRGILMGRLVMLLSLCRGLLSLPPLSEFFAVVLEASFTPGEGQFCLAGRLIPTSSPLCEAIPGPLK